MGLGQRPPSHSPGAFHPNSESVCRGPFPLFLSLPSFLVMGQSQALALSPSSQPAGLVSSKQPPILLDSLKKEIQLQCERKDSSHVPISEPVTCCLQHIQDLPSGSNTRQGEWGWQRHPPDGKVQKPLVMGNLFGGLLELSFGGVRIF